MFNKARMNQARGSSIDNTLLLRLWLGVAAALSCVVTATPFCVQTGPAAGSSFAASMVYDAATSRVHVTGSTYGSSFFRDDDDNISSDSDCFVGILQLPATSSAVSKQSPVWVRRLALGKPNQNEACSSIYTGQTGNDRKLYVTGHSTGGASVLEAQRAAVAAAAANNNNVTQPPKEEPAVYGLLIDLTWYGDVKGGYLLDKASTNYPIVVTGAAHDGKDVFVAALHSNEAHVNPAYRLAASSSSSHYDEQHQPDVTTAGGYAPPAFGSNYALSVQRLGRRPATTDELFTTPDPSYTTRVNASAELAVLAAASESAATTTSSVGEGDGGGNLSDTNASMKNNNAPAYDEYTYMAEPMEERWGRAFVSSSASSEHSSSGTGSSTSGVHVSSLLHSTINATTHVLYVAGHTRGSGPALGGSGSDGGDDSVKGFVTMLDDNLGMVRRTQHVSSSGATTDRILGLCHSSSNNGNDNSKYIYAVGMTDGTLVGSASLRPTFGVFSAFLVQLDAVTLQIKWTRQLAAATFSGPYVEHGSIHGMSCAVTPDGSQVYMAGTLKNGAAVTLDGTTPATRSAGRDDLFIAQYSTSTGGLLYVKQLGTIEDDQLAAGEGLVCDKYGNAILLGNTRGSFVVAEAETKQGLTNDVILLSVDRATGDHVDIGAPTLPIDFGPNNASSSGRSPFFDPANYDMNYLIALAILTLAVFVSLGLSLYAWRQRTRAEAKVVNRYQRALKREQRCKQDPEYGNSSSSAYGGDAIYLYDHGGNNGDNNDDEASQSTGVTLREPLDDHPALSGYKDTLLRLQVVQDSPEDEASSAHKASTHSLLQEDAL